MITKSEIIDKKLGEKPTHGPTHPVYVGLSDMAYMMWQFQRRFLHCAISE